jgi:hypothetical protein
MRDDAAWAQWSWSAMDNGNGNRNGMTPWSAILRKNE